MQTAEVDQERGNMRNALTFISFAIMGCGIDSALDSKRAMAVWIIAAMVFAYTSLIKE